jgi:acetoacetyl-CoA synthetase
MLLQRLSDRHQHDSFRETHQWSITHPGDFWLEAWEDLGIIGTPGPTAMVGKGFEGTTWFPEARLNVVNTLLAGEPEDEVLVALSETGPRRHFTRQELRDEVAACAAALQASGVRAGDRVAAWMPHVPETVIFALGALSIGAVVSTASTDFGPSALVDRLGQIEPTVLLTHAHSSYAGTVTHHEGVLEQVLPDLPSVTTVLVVGGGATHTRFEDWIAPHRGAPLNPVELPFDHPGFILFSSGTTGKPKCIVHRAAGVLLKVLSEQGYHLDIGPGDRVLYATTCGWMMWNWLVMGLGRGATIVLVDGSPGYPDLGRLWSITAKERVSFLGVSAALIDAWRKAELSPRDYGALDTLRTIASTGSPLAPEGYDWIAQTLSPEVVVASIAGGTDLCGCLVLGVATEPVRRGEISGPALGLDVGVVDHSGVPLSAGEEGELVCRTPFPSTPLYFWGDSDGSRLRGAYFDRFEGIWAHGDFATTTPSGGFVILGRLDATLNAKGVRIGTAEIYRVVLSIPGIHDALAVAQPHDGDSRIVLFVVTSGELDEDLEARIRSELRSQASPRHVPSVIARAPEVPRTRSGKMMELAVADILAGRPERDTSSLANPESLEWFRAFARNSLAP